jgi:hypothetical protein
MALGAITGEQVDGMLIVIFETQTFFCERADAAPGVAPMSRASCSWDRRMLHGVRA